MVGWGKVGRELWVMGLWKTIGALVFSITFIEEHYGVRGSLQKALKVVSKNGTW